MDHERQTEAIVSINHLSIDLALTPCCSLCAVSAQVDGECKLPVCAIYSMSDVTRVKYISRPVVVESVCDAAVSGVKDFIVGLIAGISAIGADSDLRYYEGICVEVRVVY